MQHYRFIYCFFLGLLLSCNRSDRVTVLGDVSKELREISGIEYLNDSGIVWALNDSGNKPRLYGLGLDAKTQNVLKIKANNKDWEDITSDPSGNLYIGDFGNNANDRKDLRILKVNASQLDADKKVVPEVISFEFEDQKAFPPKKKQMFYDCEAFFFFNDAFYIFTKSRVKHKIGATTMYKIPATPGHHMAKVMGKFTTCKSSHCWITAADINADGSAMALLTSNQVWVFKNYTGDAFLSGDAFAYDLGFTSQKESLSFKDNHTLLIADEYSHGEGGNLYQLDL